MTGPGYDVAGPGAVAVDDIIYVEHYPAPDSKAPVVATRREGGGLTGTALVAAARLGAGCAYFGVLGQDQLSRYTVGALEAEGIDCGNVLYREGARPIHSVIIVDQGTGERCILFDLDGCQERGPREVGEDVIAQARVLFLDYTIAVSGLRALEAARSRGVPTVGDIESMAGADVLALAEALDHLIVGLDHACVLTGAATPEAATRALARADRACVVVTDGARGCWWSEHGGSVRHFPAFPVHAVDTTGCGDVFHGAYAARLAAGDPVECCIEVASAAAAIKATRPGGRTGCPDLPTVRSFVEERRHDTR